MIKINPFRETFIILCMAVFLLTPCIHAQLVTFPAPSGAPVSSEKFSVSVRQNSDAWQEIPLYDFFDQQHYNHTLTAEPHVGSFESQGEVEVKVEVKFPVTSYIVRPLSHKITSTLNANTITLKMSDAVRRVVIEINGEKKKPLLVFSNPVNANPPATGSGKKILDNGGIYFGPGYYTNENIELNGKSWPKIYLSGGAIVNGNITMINCQNFSIEGSGYLYSTLGNVSKVPLKIDGCSHGEVKNVSVFSREENWTVWIHASDHITFNNTKVVGEIRDGINPINSQYVTLINNYIQSQDDAISLKGLEYAPMEPVEHFIGYNNIQNNIGGGWGLCRCLGEDDVPYATDLKFINTDVIHNMNGDSTLKYDFWPEGVFQLVPDLQHEGVISNVLIENIRIEDAEDSEYIFEIGSLNSKMTIEDVTIRDVRITNGPFRTSRIYGQPGYPTKNVNIESYFNRDNLINDTTGGKVIIGPYVENVTFIPQGKMMDEFKDLSKVFSKSAGWSLESGRLGHDLDESRILRTADTEEFLIYRMNDIKEFFLQLKFHSNFTSKELKFQTSSDNLTYTDLNVVKSNSWDLGGGWKGYFYWQEAHKLSNVKFLKVIVPQGTGANWSHQIGEIKFSGTPHPDPNSTFDELQSTGIVLYPNPAQNQMMLIGKEIAMDEVEGIDIMGKNFPLKCEREGEAYKLDLAHLSQGLYILKVTTTEGIVITKKFEVR